MKNRIVFIVATQYDNVGDLLINKCLIDQLATHSEVYLDVKNVPSNFQSLLLEDHDNVFDLKKLTPYSFKGLSVFLLLFSNIGINKIFKSPGPFGSGGNKKSFFKNMTIGLIYKLFRLKGLKSYLVGNDIMFKDKLDRITVEYFSKWTEKILCRSFNNLKALKELGITNADYIPDMCFGFTPNEGNKCKTNKIGISFRSIDDPLYQQEIINSIQCLLNQDSSIEVVFFYQVNRDYEYNKFLFNEFSTYNNVSFKEDCLEWEEISFYNDFAYTLSNRLHVLLLGLVHGVVPLALLNEDAKIEKIKNIFEGVGLENLIFDHLNNDDFQKILELRQEFAEEIRRTNINQKNIISSQIANLFE